MGLVKRSNMWWMSFTYQGQQVRRSTGTADKRLAEAILGKIKVQIVEGLICNRCESALTVNNTIVISSVPPRSVALPWYIVMEMGNQKSDTY